MAALVWDKTGERTYETGVDRGVLFVMKEDGSGYEAGVAWNGLTGVTESPSGAEASAQYADNIKYLTLTSAEEFGATIEAFTYPPEFAPCDGQAEPAPGVTVGQQARRKFGFVYRTKVGNDTAGTNYGYKLHLIYGATASPSEREYATVNDSPEAQTLSWEVTTDPVETGVDGLTATAQVTIDSTKVDKAKLTQLEDQLYGRGADNAEPTLPSIADVVALFNQPAVIEVTSVTVSGDGGNLTVGQTRQLTATVAPDNATDKSVTWTSSDNAKATVSSTGLVTAKAAGNVTITATSGSKSGTKTITVVAAGA